jgi:hypothetical protein
MYVTVGGWMGVWVGMYICVDVICVRELEKERIGMAIGIGKRIYIQHEGRIALASR